MLSKTIRVLAVHAFFLFPAGVHAQGDTLYLSVTQLFERISRQHLQLAADKIREQMAGERIRTARAQRLPEIVAGLRGGYLGQPVVWESGLNGATYPHAPHWQQQYSIEVSQPLYQGGKIKYAIRQSRLDGEIARLQTQADEADLKLTLLDSYLKLFSLYKQRVVLCRNIEESERRLKDIRRLKEEGVITNNDVLRSEMQLTDSRLAMTETENNIRIISRQLDILLGLDEHLLLRPDTTLLDQSHTILQYADYVESACRSNRTVRLLGKQTERAENSVGLVRAALYPDIRLTASNVLARPVSRTLADLYNNNWNIGLSVSYPLSSLYRDRHRVREARQHVLLMRNAEAQEKQRIRMAVQTALLDYRQSADRAEALKLSVRQAEENYRIMRNRYMNQLAILTDLLDADNLRLNAELQLTTARTRVVYAYYELQRAAGAL